MLGFSNLPWLSELIVQYFETFISYAFWWNYEMVIEKMYHKDVQTYFRWCRLIYVHSIHQGKDLKSHTIGSYTEPHPKLKIKHINFGSIFLRKAHESPRQGQDTLSSPRSVPREPFRICPKRVQECPKSPRRTQDEPRTGPRCLPRPPEANSDNNS